VIVVLLAIAAILSRCIMESIESEVPADSVSPCECSKDSSLYQYPVFGRSSLWDGLFPGQHFLANILNLHKYWHNKFPLLKVT
jgi:hypothetical protein